KGLSFWDAISLALSHPDVLAPVRRWRGTVGLDRRLLAAGGSAERGVVSCSHSSQRSHIARARKSKGSADRSSAFAGLGRSSEDQCLDVRKCLAERLRRGNRAGLET